MLHELVNYARNHGIEAEPGFRPKSARWAVVCSAKGDYLGVVELGNAGAKKNRGKEFPKAPNLTQPEMVGATPKSHFLIESAEVVAGVGKDGEKEKTVAKRAYFIALLERASKAMPELGAAATVLHNGRSVAALRSDLEQQKASAADGVTVQVDGKFPVESDAWHEWWRRFRRQLGASKDAEERGASEAMLCLLTGKPAEPAPTHEKIRGLAGVGGLATGDVLIGFDKESSRSYGLEQSANAAMSEIAAKTYVEALNDLIAKHSALVAGTRVVHWFRRRVAAEDDPLDWLTEGGEAEDLNAQARVRKLLESIRIGERSDLASNTYFATTLSGNSGRVVVRDWMEGSFDELVANVDRWFSDLEIVNRNGSGSAKPPKLAAVLGALGRELKDVPAPMAAKFYRLAVRGEPIPAEAMAQVQARTRLDVIQNEPANHARMGLIKTYHLRKQGGEMKGELRPGLNAEIKNAAYQCGRLMAVLGRLQYRALGGVGAGVVQRYYAAASATPALVFGRLIRGAQFHLNKIENSGAARWYEQQIAEICGHIGTSMPATLSLEDQSLFALGYYQQLAALLAGKGNQNIDKETDENGSN